MLLFPLQRSPTASSALLPAALSLVKTPCVYFLPLLKEDQVGNIQGWDGVGWAWQEKEQQLEALRKQLEISAEEIEAQAAELEEIRSAAKGGPGRKYRGG